MVTDTERNYQGTNFAVTTLIVLLVLVGGYFAVAHINDMYDDSAVSSESAASDIASPTAAGQ